MEANLILHVKVGMGLQGYYYYQVIYMHSLDGWKDLFSYFCHNNVVCKDS